MDDRIKCLRCDRMVLPVTAQTNHGLCGRCRNLARREGFEEIVVSWERDPTKIPGTNGIPEPADLALAIRARQMREMRSEKARIEQVCHDFFDAAHSKWRERGAGSLSDKEKHTLAVETFLGEVTNGGLVQYLGNESCAFANWASEGFARIGLPKLAEIMREVQALFPNSEIPEAHDDSWPIVEALDTDVLERIERRFWDRGEAAQTEIRTKLHAYLTEK